MLLHENDNNCSQIVPKLTGQIEVTRGNCNTSMLNRIKLVNKNNSHNSFAPSLKCNGCPVLWQMELERKEK